MSGSLPWIPVRLLTRLIGLLPTPLFNLPLFFRSPRHCIVCLLMSGLQGVVWAAYVSRTRRQGLNLHSYGQWGQFMCAGLGSSLVRLFLSFVHCLSRLRNIHTDCFLPTELCSGVPRHLLFAWFAVLINSIFDSLLNLSILYTLWQ